MNVDLIWELVLDMVPVIISPKIVESNLTTQGTKLLNLRLLQREVESQVMVEVVQLVEGKLLIR